MVPRSSLSFVKNSGVPQCVLGLVMFVIVAVLSVLILRASRPRGLLSTQVNLSLVGTLFAGSLSFYELWIQQPPPVTMPSCVYGFFLFLGVFLAATLARQDD